ncbi:hypothetical protein [Alcanivorax sp. 1008]|uniref:hypothetical protein n=1 Tax=Alcanivorax sp. 1008 TaxID=2816853 RepID=UPI001E2A4E67|nr:hypothetical protein [Alcanivorax sp. 1008]
MQRSETVTPEDMAAVALWHDSDSQAYFSSTTEKITGTLKVVAKQNAISHSDDEERDVSEPLDLDPEDLLGTIEQVEETLTIMTTVVSQLKEQLMEQLGVVDSRDMSVEEFLEICENSDGIVH